MKHLKYVIYREFITRVRKKSFILTTLLLPVFIGIMLVSTILLASSSAEKLSIVVKDETMLFEDKFRGLDQKNVFFHYSRDDKSIEEWKQDYSKDYNALIYIPIIDVENPRGITIFADQQIDFSVQKIIEDAISEVVRHQVLLKNNYNIELIDKLSQPVSIETIVKDKVQSGKNYLSSGLGYLSGFMIYMFLLIYGSMVMKGVSEEKTTRIIEVLATMVKPFDLMLGKIIGIGMVGIFQVAIWFGLIVLIQTIIGLVFAGQVAELQTLQATGNANNSSEMIQFVSEGLASLDTINFSRILFSFVFYFLFGYIFYAAQFAAIGSAVTDDTDVQSMTFPIIMPIIIAMVIMSIVIEQPFSPVAFWASMIPFTSPIVMIARIPYNVSWIQQLASMLILIISSIGMVFLASRIYRVGILIQGKKINFKEIFKWVFVKY